MERETTGLRTRAAPLLLILGSLAGCGGDAADDRQPAGWPRPPAQQIANAVDGLLPAAAIEAERCILRFGRRTVEVVGTTPDGEPILYCNGMRIAVDADLLASNRVEDVFTLLRKLNDPQLGSPPGPGEVHHAHGRAHFDPLLDIRIVFPTTVLTAGRSLRREIHAEAQLAETWRADDLTIERLHRPQASDVFIERSAGRLRVALAPPSAPAPASSPLHDAWLVVELLPMTEPADTFTADAVRSARLVTAARRLAEWNKKDGFVCDREYWAREVCAGIENPALLPPHVAVTDPAGDLIALCTDRGVLRPVASRAPAAIEAFLVDAARVSSDLGRFHLLASYFFERKGDEGGRGNHHADAAGALATARGGIACATDDEVAAVIVAVLERQGRSAALVGSPGSLAAMWIEARDGEVQIDLLRRGAPAHFAAPSLEAALAAAAQAIEADQVMDPGAIPTWRIDVATDVAIRTAVDARALLSGARLRGELQLIEDLSQGLLGTAADFISSELERETSGADPLVLRRLAELRFATAEPRGALALADRARAIEPSRLAQFPLARLALIAAVAAGDARPIRERHRALAALAGTALEDSSPLARTRALAATVRAIDGAGAPDLAASFATEVFETAVEALLDGTGTEPRRAERLREIVRVLAATAPRCTQAAGRDAIAPLLGKIAATTGLAPPEVCAEAEFAALRARLGPVAFLAQARDRVAGGAASPHDDEASWRRFDAHPHCWLPLIEDLIDGRQQGAQPADLGMLLAHLETTTAHDPDLDAWIDLFAVAGGAADARARLRRLADREDRDRIEARIARLARATGSAAATQAMQAWVALIGDDASWLRVAWLAVQSGNPDWARHCAQTGSTTGEETALRLRQKEATHIQEAITRIEGRRAPPRPPR